MKVLLLILLPGLVAAQCPETHSADFSCTSAGGNTHITLFADAELSWDRFEVSPEASLQITSEGGAGFASRHIVTGFTPSRIAGEVSADGSFTLISPRGINIVNGGRITAPEVTLSTLSANAPMSYRGSTRAGTLMLSGTVVATAGDATLLGYRQSITGTGGISVSKGKARLIATGGDTVSGPDFQITPATMPAQRPGRIDTTGNIEAPIVEIYSDGFIGNGGRISGPDRVRLEAGGRITHDNRPGSLIESNDLVTVPETILEGTVTRPRDGSNPGGISTTLGFPDLKNGSFSGKRKTTLLPAQYSASNVSRSRLPSAVSLKKKRANTSRLVTRGSTVKKKRKSKKRSFFGTVIKK